MMCVVYWVWIRLLCYYYYYYHLRLGCTPARLQSCGPAPPFAPWTVQESINTSIRLEHPLREHKPFRHCSRSLHPSSPFRFVISSCSISMLGSASPIVE
ncbi:hypothetical protein BO99DRAFT_754 [Aspergillus violaceofuscus CBS 115571]|uniref:Uncharacterized protein n=1 Tax=Aspergillus violaceofuscus (strain CBS 115571) TaxID=1450538 RepID=A0A2V5IL54_ASPV1|nr:hypothetical protein BO99DRAFT_754 [Aspergillus violaceofuscus CBS 115571]